MSARSVGSRPWAWLAPVVFVIAASGVAPGCEGEDEPPSWETDDCTAEERALIDESIQLAATVEEYVQQAADATYGAGIVDQRAILDRLQASWADGRIRCGTLADEQGQPVEEPGAVAQTHADLVLLNRAYPGWVLAAEQWEAGRAEAGLTPDELDEAAARFDYPAFATFRDQLADGYRGRAFVANVLVHEVVHLVHDDCCHHDESSWDTPGYRDLVSDVGTWTESGILWALWGEQRQRLNEAYREGH